MSPSQTFSFLDGCANFGLLLGQVRGLLDLSLRKDPISFEIFNGHIPRCENLQTNQAEAGTIIIHDSVASVPTNIIIVADDTDIFVLLLHFTFIGYIKSQVYMQPTDKESSARVIDIAATYQDHTKIMPNTLAAHGLSGCHRVCSYFDIAKKIVINVLNKKNIDLSSIGFLYEPLKNYLKEGINFLLDCYGQSKVETLNDARKKVRKYSIVKSKSASPKLASLPPTDKYFFQKLKRRNLQIAVCRCSLNADLPTNDINHYG